MAAKLLNGKFDDPVVKDVAELKAALIAGKTFSEVYNKIAALYVTDTSYVMAGVFNYMSKSYKASITKGFKLFLTKLEIV